MSDVMVKSVPGRYREPGGGTGQAQSAGAAVAARRWMGLGWLACSLLVAAPAWADQPVGKAAAPVARATSPVANANGVHEYRLDNGMRVLVKPDRRAAVVVSQLWYRVGSVDEPVGMTGVSHVVEHMMFKGTPRVPAGEFSRQIAAAGGSENAFTSRDYTGYFQRLQKDQLPLALRLEADRMQNLVLADAEFRKEIEVIKEERRWRTDDSPTGTLFEQFNAAAYTAHPYRVPVIGWMHDLNQLTIQDVRQWYKTWYVPNNAILVVVGDVQPEAVHALARQYFGKLRAAPLPVRKPMLEPEQKGVRRIVVKAPSELPVLTMGWRVPKLEHIDDRESYALDVLAAVLDGDEAARFERHLVRETRVAQSVGASYDGVGRGPGMFYVQGTPGTGHRIEELEAAVRAQIARVAREGVTEAELERVKTQVIAGQIYKRDSMFAQAREIGSLEAVGLSHRLIDLWVERLREVTPAQVQAAAARYFGDDQLTVAVLDPQPIDPQAARKRATGGRHHE